MNIVVGYKLFELWCFLQGRETMEAPRGVTVFHAAADHRGGNATQKGVRQTVDKMRQVSHTSINLSYSMHGSHSIHQLIHKPITLTAGSGVALPGGGGGE